MTIASMTAQAGPLTQQGTVVGTFQYVAPEVLQGRDADARSDIFALGAVLYEMLTAQAPAIRNSHSGRLWARRLATSINRRADVDPHDEARVLALRM